MCFWCLIKYKDGGVAWRKVKLFKKSGATTGQDNCCRDCGDSVCQGHPLLSYEEILVKALDDGEFLEQCRLCIQVKKGAMRKDC